MKKTMMLAIACTIALNSNAQMRLGTYHSDSLQLVTNSANRMFILSDGRISMNGGLVQDAGGNTASVSIGKRAIGDAAALLLSDNVAQPTRNAQLSILNHSSDHALYAYHNKFSTSTNTLTDKNIASEGSNFGFYRYAQITQNNYDYFGYYCYNYNVSYAHNNINITSYESGGISLQDYISWNDYSAVDYYKNPGTTITGTRYGVNLSFSKQGGDAWGVYQSHSSVKNHFNGASLFGSTTDNGYDKVQVTGNTKTDGFSANIITTTNTSYSASVNDHTILANFSSGTITLPIGGTGGVSAGKIFYIKKVFNSASTINIQPSSGNIDFGASVPLSNYLSCIAVQFDGTDYYVIGGY